MTMSRTSFKLTRRDTAVTAILCYVKGFACACGLGTVHLFEKSDEAYFSHIRSVTVMLRRRESCLEKPSFGEKVFRFLGFSLKGRPLLKLSLGRTSHIGYTVFPVTSIS